jgi:hypothetical protein
MPQLLHAGRGALAWGALALHAAGAGAAAPLELQVRSDRHSDLSSLSQLDGEALERLSARGGRNLAYQDEEVRITAGAGPWQVSLLARSRATLVLSDRALGAAQHVAGLQRTAADEAWTGEARLRGFRGAGLELARRFSWPSGWRADAAVQALLLTGVRDRSIQGDLSYGGATGRYEFDLRSTERDHRRRLPFQSGVASRGGGLLVALELAWQGEHFGAGLAVRDLGVLRWRGLPEQHLVLASATRDLDADGFIVYRPLLQGQNRQLDGTFAAPAWGSVHASYRPLPGASVRAVADHVPGFGLLPSVSWTQQFAGWSGALGWRWHERRLEGSVDVGPLRLTAGADLAHAGRRSRVLALAWRLPL